MTWVKICGINSESAFDVSVECGADYIGFNFFSRSPRYVTPRQAAALSARHVGGPQRVGLFVDPAPADIQHALDAISLDILQIYGDAALCESLAQKFRIRAALPVGVGSQADLPGATAADYLLIEAKAPPGATRPGGNAVTMDWAMLRGWRAPAPWLLAGGLTAENVAEAIEASGARGVDVASGVESLPGVKSPALIRRFIANARSAARPVG